MREILFRGKRRDNGEWSYGSLQCFKGFSIFDNSLKNFITVDSKTVGQYTGLTDKNGKKVFEGDILKQKLKSSDTYILKVVKYEMSCGSCCTQVIGFGASGNLHIDFIHLDEPFEVIGNIHDNPELLENGK